MPTSRLRRVAVIVLEGAKPLDVGTPAFLGGVYAGAARTAAVPLSLGADRWLVETIRDGADSLVRSRRIMRGGDTLTVGVAANGRFATLAHPWRPGATTCSR
ncbi:hypothetical protein ACW4TU_00815 [Streptomyces sp. QTS52]